MGNRKLFEFHVCFSHVTHARYISRLNMASGLVSSALSGIHERF